ncbi:MAG: hypothetical protein QNK37_13365 [Acidobacteriota bacterium]|nr:hypothetical protein [Acidobacteriota bacterium]
MSSSPGMMWLVFALCTVACWGLYGIFLHSGQLGMADQANGRMKAFFVVGIAYLLSAVIGTAIIMWLNGSDWVFPAKGVWWSLFAGLVGAIGALFVLLAFGAKGTPTVVMSIIFAGAPIVNAIVSMIMHPPASGSVKPQFFLGILLAALGGFLVAFYKPAPGNVKKPAAEQAVSAPADHN